MYSHREQGCSAPVVDPIGMIWRGAIQQQVAVYPQSYARPRWATGAGVSGDGPSVGGSTQVLRLGSGCQRQDNSQGRTFGGIGPRDDPRHLGGYYNFEKEHTRLWQDYSSGDTVYGDPHRERKEACFNPASGAYGYTDAVFQHIGRNRVSGFDFEINRLRFFFGTTGNVASFKQKTWKHPMFRQCYRGA